MKFTPAIPDDLPQIAEWLAADPSKAGVLPEWFLTGADCIVAFCVEDESGPVLYCRFDREGDLARMHTLFMPEDPTSKKRIACMLLDGFSKVAELLATDFGIRGVVFESTSPSLIAFMAGLGFNHIGQHDYAMAFRDSVPTTTVTISK